MITDIKSKRLDHHGLVAGVIKDIKLVEFFNKHLGDSGDGEISYGEAIAGMIINGLGFTDRPISLTPQFFEQLPMETLFRDGVEASHFNRHKLGRTLDMIYKKDPTSLFTTYACQTVKDEKISLSSLVNDTTTFNVTGKKYENTDENEITLTKGYSKDHRPDLLQAVHELVVSTDGGIPMYSKSHDGNSSDTVIFRERVEELKKQIEFDVKDCLWVADSKLYTEETLSLFSDINFLTRVPETNKEVKIQIKEAIKKNDFIEIRKGLYASEIKINHFGVTQKWVICYSKDGLSRAKKTIQKRIEQEKERIDKKILHNKKDRYACKEDAIRESKEIFKNLKFHSIKEIEITPCSVYNRRGRPKEGQEPDRVEYKIQFNITENDNSTKVLEKACFVLATNSYELPMKKIVKEYKKQGHVERGFRFMKEPYFFVSSLYLKSPKRIQALLMVMTLSLLVYSIAQRRLRNSLEENNDTIPNQISKEIKNPTMRWVFQMFFGINIIDATISKIKQRMINGIKTLHVKILEYVSEAALKMYTSCKAIG